MLLQAKEVYSLQRFFWFQAFYSQLNVKAILRDQLIKKKKNIEEVKIVSSDKHVYSYTECRDESELGYYFKDFDIFELFSERKNVVNTIYHPTEDDYYEYFNRNYPPESRIFYYRKYIIVKSRDVPIWCNDYSSPLSFLAYFEKQLVLYVDVLRSVSKSTRVNGRRFVMVGDGPGTAAIAAVCLQLDYVSFEPNVIGNIAKRIGLITPGDVKYGKEDILCLFNVCMYLTEEQKRLYYNHDRVVIVDANIPYIPPGFDPSMVGAAKVYSKGCSMSPLLEFPLASIRPMFVQSAWKSAEPVDDKARVMCDLMHIPVHEKGVKVTSDVMRPEFHIYTRNDPKNNKVGKKRVMKQILGNN